MPEPTGELDAAALEEWYAEGTGHGCAGGQGYLRANFVVSLDGAVEVGGRSAALGGAADRDVFTALRVLCDVVLVGAGTLRAENYGQAHLDSEQRRRRAERARRRGLDTAGPPAMAVVTASGDIGRGSRLFAAPPGSRRCQPAARRPLVLTCEAAPRRWREDIAEVAEVLVCGADSVDLPAGLAALAERGLSQVLCEGGPSLLASLMSSGLVDELCLTHAPLLVGTGKKHLAAGAPLQAPERFALSHLVEGGGFLFARYARIGGGLAGRAT